MDLSNRVVSGSDQSKFINAGNEGSFPPESIGLQKSKTQAEGRFIDLSSYRTLKVQNSGKGYFTKGISLLNGMSDKFLDGLAYLGKKYNDLPKVTSPVIENIIGVDTNSAANYLNVTNSDFIDHELAEVMVERLGKPGLISRGLAKVGSLIDGATGVMSTIGMFSKERDLGKHDYSETMKSAFISAGKISAGAAAATIATGVVVGSSSIAAPAILVGGAAWMGGVYLYNKALEIFI